MVFTKVAAVWKEPQGFSFESISSDNEYIFIQFQTPVIAYLRGTGRRLNRAAVLFGIITVSVNLGRPTANLFMTGFIPRAIIPKLWKNSV